jgi:hypothetical protein
MKLTKSLLMVAMLTGVAIAQTPATKSSSAPAPAKVSAPQAAQKAAVPAKSATAPAKPAPAPVKQAAAPAKPTMPATKPEHVATTPHVATKHTMPKHVAKAHPAAKKAAVVAAKTVAAEKPAAPASDATTDAAPEIKRGRDPFVSVIMERSGNFSCAGTGKKCLIVDQVMLKGVVRSQNESIAVVSSTANKTYFLRENDPVYNGVVVKITPDSIVFRESVTDRLGKTVQREVVKKVNNPAA